MHFFFFLLAGVFFWNTNLLAQPTSLKTIAILPTVTNIQKEALRPGIDSVSWAQIQEKEALSSQSKNYYLLAQKKPNYNVTFQPINQTNALLQQAGISITNLAGVTQQELAQILGVDLLFYGVNYRLADPNTPEGRLAKNAGLSLLLPPGFNNLARVSGQPVTAMHYLLYDRRSNKAIWQYELETSRPGDWYIEKLRRFLAYNFPLRK